MRNGGGKSRATVGVARSRNPISLREESTGKRQIKDRGGSNNAKSFLKLEHLQKLAVWASGEASIPSLGSFFGYRLAATAESLGVSPHSSLFACQRCETILQPGINCTIRIEKKKSKGLKQSIKQKDLVQNNVVYTCHFCSHRNLKKGTPRAHAKCVAKDRTPSESKPNFIQKSQSEEIQIEGEEKRGQESDLTSNTTKEVALIADIPITHAKVCVAAKGRTSSESKLNFMHKSLSNEIRKEGEEKSEQESDLTSNTTKEVASIADSPITPVIKIGKTLLDGKRKRNRSSTKKQNDPKSILAQTDRDDVDCSAVKLRRKSWTSLKEIAQAENKQTL